MNNLTDNLMHLLKVILDLSRSEIRHDFGIYGDYLCLFGRHLTEIHETMKDGHDALESAEQTWYQMN